MNIDEVYTWDRKEAYEFAKLVKLCAGVNKVKVRRDHEGRFEVSIEFEMWARGEICNIAIANNFEGLDIYRCEDGLGEVLGRMVEEKKYNESTGE